MSRSGITRWDFDVSVFYIASHCGERICLAFSCGYKLPGGRLTGISYEQEGNY